MRHWAHSTNMAPAAGQSCYSSHVTDFSQLPKLLEEASSFSGSEQFAEQLFSRYVLAPNSARFSCQAQGNPRTFGSVTPHLQLLSFKFSCVKPCFLRVFQDGNLTSILQRHNKKLFADMGANLGVLPPEYNKAVHGPYDPAIYYGKKVNQQ